MTKWMLCTCHVRRRGRFPRGAIEQCACTSCSTARRCALRHEPMTRMMTTRGLVSTSDGHGASLSQASIIVVTIMGRVWDGIDDCPGHVHVRADSGVHARLHDVMILKRWRRRDREIRRMFSCAFGVSASAGSAGGDVPMDFAWAVCSVFATGGPWKSRCCAATCVPRISCYAGCGKARTFMASRFAGRGNGLSGEELGPSRRGVDHGVEPS